eukprot:5192279-Prymnesium_polylepis.1
MSRASCPTNVLSVEGPASPSERARTSPETTDRPSNTARAPDEGGVCNTALWCVLRRMRRWVCGVPRACGCVACRVRV